MLLNCLDSLVQKCQSGVVIYFEKIGQDPVAIGDGKPEYLLSFCARFVKFHY